jgi:hypothetical protein
MNKNIKKTLTTIARDTLGVFNLEPKGRDRDDFKTLSVQSLTSALERAYEAGKQAGAREQDGTNETRKAQNMMDPNMAIRTILNLLIDHINGEEKLDDLFLVHLTGLQNYVDRGMIRFTPSTNEHIKELLKPFPDFVHVSALLSSGEHGGADSLTAGLLALEFYYYGFVSNTKKKSSISEAMLPPYNEIVKANSKSFNVIDPNSRWDKTNE